MKGRIASSLAASLRRVLLVAAVVAAGCHGGTIRPVGTGAAGATGDGGSGSDVFGDGEAGDADSERPATLPPCASVADCRAQGLGQQHLCWKGACVDLRTNDCPFIRGVDAVPGEPLVVGLIYGGDVHSASALALQANVRLAVDELVAGVPIGGSLRRPVVLLCEATDANQLGRSLDHLIDDVGVPAVAAVLAQDDLVYAAQRTSVAGKKVLFLDFGAPAAELSNLKDEGLVWHMLSDPPQLAPSYVPLLARAEAHVNAGDPPPAPTRVAIVVDPRRPFDAETAELLQGSLRINGRPAAEQLGGSFRVYTTAEVAVGPIVDLVPSAPHVVIALADPQFVDWMIGATEDGFAELGGRPPFYLLSPGATHFPALQDRVRAANASSLRTRIAGVNWAAAADPTLYDEYLERLMTANRGVQGLEGSENYYDMMYLLFYAAAAADPTPPWDGAKLAAGLRRVIDVAGPPLDIGPAQMDEVFARLAVPGQTLRLTGTLGPADFDEATGVARIGGSVWCLDADGSYRYDVLRYDRLTQQLEGSFPCYAF